MLSCHTPPSLLSVLILAVFEHGGFVFGPYVLGWATSKHRVLSP